jgi:O-antigen/teichoic acid export membrane protein
LGGIGRVAGLTDRALRRLLSIGATPTADSRSTERYRRAALTAVTTGGARAVSILTTVLVVPLALGYLGKDEFGLWAMVVSLTSVVAFADFGLGNGLINAVAEADGNDDEHAARRYVSSSFFMLLATMTLLGVVFVVATQFVSWASVFNVEGTPASGEAMPAVVALVVCVLVSMPLGVAERVQMGYQEGFVNGLWQLVGAGLSIVGLLVALSLHADVRWLVLAVAGGPVTALALNATALFGRRRRTLVPRLRQVTGAAVRRMLHYGYLFFVLQLAVAVAFVSDTIVAGQVLGPAAATDYAVPMRLFSVVSTAVLIALTPLWPAYREALTRGDAAWARRTLARSLKLTVATTAVAALFLVVVGRPLVEAWSGGEVSPSTALLSSLALWMVLMSCGNVFAMFLNGANVVRFQVVTAVVMASTALVAKIVLAREVGLPGIVWGTIVCYTLFTLLPTVVYVPRLLHSLET